MIIADSHLSFSQFLTALLYIMSSSVLPLRKKEGPTSDAWRALRETITELYQNKTLKEVIRIMGDEHQFYAR
jgi:hypothetical protein